MGCFLLDGMRAWDQVAGVAVRLRASGNRGRKVGTMALVLLIDDDPFYCGLIQQALADEGHVVLTAQDGVEGIARYRDQSPDLVITDMRMPGVDGGEVIRNLRSIDDRARIIAVSGAPTFYDVDYFKLAQEVGANTVLRKLDPMDRVIVEVNRL